MGFSSKSKGGKSYKKALDKASKALKDDLQILVGIPQNTLPYPDGTSTALVASVHEFGSASRGIPERSFLRTTLFENRNKYIKLLRKVAERSVEKGLALVDGAALIGEVVQGDVVDKITSLSAPPLKPSTVKGRKQGSSNPLVDTGHLRQSIRYEVREGSDD